MNEPDAEWRNGSPIVRREFGALEEQWLTVCTVIPNRSSNWRMSISMRFTVLKSRVRIHPIRLLAGFLSIGTLRRFISRMIAVVARARERVVKKIERRPKRGPKKTMAPTCPPSIVGPITFHAQRYSSDHEPKRFRCIIYPLLKSWLRPGYETPRHP